MRSSIILALKGAVMGIAEVIPGVSGGTIAFITGIYQQLIESIKNVDIELFRLILRGSWQEAWLKVDGRFLINLLIGMIGGLVIGVFLITYLMETHPEILWGFFFGLVLASSIYIAKQLDFGKLKILGIVVIGIVTAVVITTLTPAGGSEALGAVFLSAMVAIIALILPGISGGFILLLLGMYSVIVPNVKELIVHPNQKSLIICIVFGLGALVGLALFSRVLSYAFLKYRHSTIALLTGFMVGSLYKIWPWRNPQIVLNKESGLTTQIGQISDLENLNLDAYKIIKEQNVLPLDYYTQSDLLWVLLAFAGGFISIFLIEYLNNQLKKPQDSAS